jgi:hypothetical protein
VLTHRNGPPEPTQVATRAAHPLASLDVTDRDDPDFGPSGYLPDRAAKRARKIILRAPLGLQWVIASVVAGLVLVVAGVLFVQRGSSPPGEPWVEVGPVSAVRASSYDEDLDVLLVGAAGRVRAFAGASEVAWCPASNRLEAPDGRVWSLTGRGLGGTPSLTEHPILVVNDLVYLDPTRTIPAPEPSAEGVEPGCADPVG